MRLLHHALTIYSTLHGVWILFFKLICSNSIYISCPNRKTQYDPYHWLCQPCFSTFNWYTSLFCCQIRVVIAGFLVPLVDTSFSTSVSLLILKCSNYCVTWHVDWQLSSHYHSAKSCRTLRLGYSVGEINSRALVSYYFESFLEISKNQPPDSVAAWDQCCWKNARSSFTEVLVHKMPC